MKNLLENCTYWGSSLVDSCYVLNKRYTLCPYTPVIFVVLNYYSNRKDLIKSMEREGDSNLGTVYFPISLIVLILLTWDGGLLGGGNLKYLGAVGSLIMGYGDGFAAIIGFAASII